MDNISNNFPSEEDINKISNYKEGCKILIKLDLMLECVNNLDDVKEVLRLKYHPTKEIEDEIQKCRLYEEYPDLMNKLKVLIGKMERFKKSRNFKNEFGKIFKLKENKLKSIFKSLKEKIECQKFPIIIAGESKTGKSTFINLLLNKDLLPTGLSTCTRMICEIQNSKEESVTFTGPNVIETTFGIENLKKIEEIIKAKIDDGYDRASFKYPVNFLENYTYLVDSPGIGDTFNLENMTLEYVSKNSPAIIFVLNSTNSYGLNIKAKELILKTKDIFNSIKNLFSGFQNSKYIFKYEKAIFIFNYMDIIETECLSKSDFEDFKNNIVSEVQTLWHKSIDVKRQIFFISAKKAGAWQKEGIVQEVITNIQNSIKRLIVYIYERNLQDSIKELNLLCSKFEKKILEKLNNIVDYKYRRLTDKINEKDICLSLQNILNDIDNKKKTIIVELKPKFDMIAYYLTEHLKSVDVKKTVIDSFQSSVKNNINDINLVVISFNEYFEKQIYKEITLWERENKQMENLYNFLTDSIDRNLTDICNQTNMSSTILNKECLLRAWNESLETENLNSLNELTEKIEKVFIISTFTLLFPVIALAGVLATPLLISHMIKERKDSKNKLLKYIDNPEKFLQDLSTKTLENLSPKIIREFILHKVETKCIELVDNFKNIILNDIKERKISINNIKNESREFPEILNSLSQLFYEMEGFYAKLEIIKIHCDSVKDEGLFVLPSIYENLIASETRITKCLSTGKFSQVFKNDFYKNVVFKMYNKEFDEQNARFQMQEIELLRKHPSDFMLRCKSVIYLKNENKVIVVLENVDCNLYTYIRENKILIPSNSDMNNEILDQQLKFVLNVDIQISLALKYLFNYDTRMVHPDLTLYSILVLKTPVIDKIKIFICDACCNLHTKSRKFKGSQQEIFDMGGFTKENIFCLGIIFYQLVCFQKYEEMGQTIVNDTNNSTETNSFQFLSLEMVNRINWEELRKIGVTNEYVELIEKCVSLKPEERPTILDIIKDLKNIMNKNNDFISSLDN